MNEKRLSVFLGEQLRKYRKMCDLTQEELAEKVNTTAQTISNYERYGIKDVEVEEELSRALGKNLREKTADKEGVVGEVGKEILYSLLEGGGNRGFEALVNSLYGMEPDRVSHEIKKIADLDMCVREKYVDFRRDECDRVFITAKGIITCKNLVNDEYHASKLGDILSSVRSYEYLLRPHFNFEKDLPVAKDMEDYIQKRPWITAIYDINLSHTYKADYVVYLYHRGALERLGMSDFNGNSDLDGYEVIFPGKNICHDILYRMAYGFTDEWRNSNFFSLLSEEWYKKDDKLFDKIRGVSETDPIMADIVSWFDSDFSWIRDDKRISEANEEISKAKEEMDDRMFTEMFVNGFDLDILNRKERYKEFAPEGLENTYPDKWFSKEEIENFIRANYHLPQNEQEREIQTKIEKVEQLRPNLKADYYTFPKEWEENGLADLVRELNGIEKDPC